MADALVHRFEQAVEIAFMPSHGGVFEVRDGDIRIFDKKDEGRFPETGEILSRL